MLSKGRSADVFGMRQSRDDSPLTWLREQRQDVGVAGSDYANVPVIEVLVVVSSR